jgi:hypothetical protein
MSAFRAIGQAYATDPLMQPSYFDPSAPAGQKWQRPAGMGPMQVVRGYHSSATLMADGSVFVAGSNPNFDYIPYEGFVDEKGTRYTYPTEYRVEMFYPEYYDKPRPQPYGLPRFLSYGGASFNVSLSAADLGNNASLVDTAQIVVMRTGYSTHAMNMGMRMVQLDSTWTLNANGSAIIHSQQMPPNPSIMAPGPALLFVVVNGVPSIGVDIVVGNGQIGQQPIYAVQPLGGVASQSGAAIQANGNGILVNGQAIAAVAPNSGSSRALHSPFFPSSLVTLVPIGIALLTVVATCIV